MQYRKQLKGARIALLEDDIAQAEMIAQWLHAAGYRCRQYADAHSFIREVWYESYDLFILDWELPDMSGIEVLSQLKSRNKGNIPVLFITHRDTERDIVKALNSGADDYISKPASREVTLVRIKALLRRGYRTFSNSSTLEVGAYKINKADSLVKLNDVPVNLTTTEYQLALILFSNMGRLLSRSYLMEAVWGDEPGQATRALDSHLSRLRRKLAITPENGCRLKAVYQQGYRLEKIDHGHRIDRNI